MIESVSMNKKYIELITIAAILIFTIFICILISMFHVKGRTEYGDVYENFYLVDDSLISGNILIKTLEYYNDSELKIIIKTNLSEEVAYIWDGERKIDNYDFKKEVTDKDYINENALFRVKVYKTGNRINYVVFKQEYINK